MNNIDLKAKVFSNKSKKITISYEKMGNDEIRILTQDKLISSLLIQKMKHKKQLTLKSANHSRQSSISSQGSENSKNKYNGCYLQISPRFDVNNGLAFKNELKEVKITSPKQECQSPHQEIIPHHRRSVQSTKEDPLKKSQFSKVIHTIDELQ